MINQNTPLSLHITGSTNYKEFPKRYFFVLVFIFKNLDIARNTDYFFVDFFFAGFLQLPFDVFPEVLHFFIAIQNHPLSFRQ
ncbi:MAG: hypothetical protein KGJ87_03055 [Planctomycetota bacterium]|nr:hypothetical protein [Planctomycetota bacterium]MDE2216130.1 hypothetical protein [Planctomycetota bacterium]